MFCSFSVTSGDRAINAWCFSDELYDSQKRNHQHNKAMSTDIYIHFNECDSPLRDISAIGGGMRMTSA